MLTKSDLAQPFELDLAHKASLAFQSGSVYPFVDAAGARPSTIPDMYNRHNITMNYGDKGGILPESLLLANNGSGQLNTFGEVFGLDSAWEIAHESKSSLMLVDAIISPVSDISKEDYLVQLAGYEITRNPDFTINVIYTSANGHGAKLENINAGLSVGDRLVVGAQFNFTNQTVLLAINGTLYTMAVVGDPWAGGGNSRPNHNFKHIGRHYSWDNNYGWDAPINLLAWNPDCTGNELTSEELRELTENSYAIFEPYRSPNHGVTTHVVDVLGGNNDYPSVDAAVAGRKNMGNNFVQKIVVHGIDKVKTYQSFDPLLTRLHIAGAVPWTDRTKAPTCGVHPDTGRAIELGGTSSSGATNYELGYPVIIENILIKSEDKDALYGHYWARTSYFELVDCDIDAYRVGIAANHQDNAANDVLIFKSGRIKSRNSAISHTRQSDIFIADSILDACHDTGNQYNRGIVQSDNGRVNKFVAQNLVYVNNTADGSYRKAFYLLGSTGSTASISNVIINRDEVSTWDIDPDTVLTKHDIIYDADYTNAFNVDGTIQHEFFDTQLKSKGVNGSDIVPWLVNTPPANILVNVDDVSIPTRIDEVNVVRNTAIGFDDLVVALSIEGAEVVRHVSVNATKAVVDSSIDNVDISRQLGVSVGNCVSHCTIDNVDVSVNGLMSVDDLVIESSIETVDITRHASVSVLELSGPCSIDDVDVARHSSIVAESSHTKTRIQDVDVNRHTSIVVEDVFFETSIDDVTISSNALMNAQGLSAKTSISQVDVAIHSQIHVEPLKFSSRITAADASRTTSVSVLHSVIQTSIDTVDLITNSSVEVQDLLVNAAIQGVEPSRRSRLNVESLVAGAAIDDVNISSNFLIDVEPVAASVSLDFVEVLRSSTVNVDALVSTTSIDNVIVLSETSLSIEPIALTTSIDNVEVTRHTAADVQNIKLNTFVDTVDISTNGLIIVESIRCKTLIDNVQPIRIAQLDVQDIQINASIDNANVSMLSHIYVDDLFTSCHIDNVTPLSQSAIEVQSAVVPTSIGLVDVHSNPFKGLPVDARNEYILVMKKEEYLLTNLR